MPQRVEKSERKSSFAAVIELKCCTLAHLALSLASAKASVGGSQRGALPAVAYWTGIGFEGPKRSYNMPLARKIYD